METEYITGAEFGRWRVDFQAFQDRLEDRLAEGFHGVHSRLDELNGRTRKNSESIVVLTKDVELLQTKGCAQLQAHRGLLDVLPETGLSSTPWARRRQLIIGGGLVTGGALIIPVIREVIVLGGEVLRWLAAH